MKGLRLAMIAAAAVIVVALTFLVPFLLDTGAGTPGSVRPDRPNDRGAPTPTLSPIASVPQDTRDPIRAPDRADAATTRTEASPDTAAATGYNISGAILDLAGTPVSQAKVLIRLTSGERAATIERRADAQGRFSAQNLPASIVPLITVQKDGFEETNIENISLPVADLNIYMKPLAGVSVEILRADSGIVSPWNSEVTLHLLKRTDPSESPPRTAGMIETARHLGGYSAVRTETVKPHDGRHHFSHVPAGTYRIAAQIGSEYAESEPFTVEAVGSSQCRIIFGLRGSLRGRVVSAETTSPLAGAFARLIQASRPAVAGAPLSWETRSEPDGLFAFEDVLPGQYTLILSADGHSTRSVEELTVRPGEGGEPATYELAKGQTALIVRTLGPSGNPAAGVRLALLNDSPAAFARARFARTGPDGMARFEPVVAGRYSLSVNYPGSRPRQKTLEVVVAEGEIREKEIRFQPLVRVSGVATRDGAPYEGLIVFTRRGNVAVEDFARADASGAYSVELEPGEYVVSRPGHAGSAQLTVPNVAAYAADLILD